LRVCCDSLDVLVIARASGLAIAVASAPRLRVDGSRRANRIPPGAHLGVWAPESGPGARHLLEARWSNCKSAIFGSGCGSPSATTIGPVLKIASKLRPTGWRRCEGRAICAAPRFATTHQPPTGGSCLRRPQGKQLRHVLVIDGQRPTAGVRAAADRGPRLPGGLWRRAGSVSGAGGKPINSVADDFRAATYSRERQNEPPTFLYAMDLGDGVAFPGKETRWPGASRFTGLYCSGASSGGWRFRRGDRSDPRPEHALFSPDESPLPDLSQAGGGFRRWRPAGHPGPG